MRRSRQGMTVLELLILIVIFSIAGGIAVAFLGSARNSGGYPEDEAQKYAQSLGIAVRGVNCTDRDTDSDGYVSCTISAGSGDVPKLIPVECAVRWSWNNGCRMPKFQAAASGVP